MPGDQFVIGVDFGTDSVRSVVVNASNGSEVAAAVAYYPRWRDGLFCNPSENQFRQHPLDYIGTLESTIIECLKKAGNSVSKNVKGISVDTTGSTPVAVDKTGTPLSLIPQFRENPNAMFVLWKDHTAVNEAAAINEHAQQFGENYLQYVGGIYSSEWFWAKLLHVLRKDEAVRTSAYSWVEHCDWIPFLLTGGDDVSKMKRGVCAAGHKALWSESFNGLPPDQFFSSLDPLLKGFTDRLFKDTYTSDKPAGRISAKWSERLGLPNDVLIGVGAFDCHMGAVGGQIEPYFLSKVMGTSTCDMMVIPKAEIGNKLVKGICGQVDGSILPGMIGLEAGQSAFGDTYAWYKNLLMWPVKKFLGSASADIEDKIIAALSDEASKLPFDENSELAIDWLNGRRTPDADQTLTGAMWGLNLASDAPGLFRAWVEATCFGARAIADRFNDEDVPVKGLIGLGGVARKSPYIMQVMADVMNMPIRIHKSEQTCAMGAAMFAATVSGIYPNADEAMNAMGQGFDLNYRPDGSKAQLYERRYQRYRELGKHIGTLELIGT
ncbi:MAG TPA: ribulokinase [Cyclobacteriaceae bacterium]|nr:ribulokinase [Cyclobacteriaceae bacterium]